MATSVSLAAVLALGAGVVGWRLARRRLRPTSSEDRQLSTVLEFANCLLWQAKVEHIGEDWKWHFSVQPTGLSRRLFENRKAPEVGGLWGQFEIDEWQEMDARCHAAVLAGKAGYEQQFHFTINGRAVWLRESVSIRRDAPNIFWLVGLVTDVTSQREAEIARQASEERVRQLLSRADCLLWQAKVSTDENGNFRWEWFIPDSELHRRIAAGRTAPASILWDETMVPEFREMEQRSHAAMLEGRPSYEHEFRVLYGNNVLWMHEQVSVRAVGPREWTLEGIATDVTGQHQAEESKRESEAQLQRVLETAEFLLWHARVFLSPSGHLHWVTTVPRSQLYIRVFGREPDGSNALPWKEIVTPSLYDEMVARADGAIVGGAPGYEQEVRGQRGDDVFWLLEQSTIRKISATEWHLVGILTDVTVRHRAEEARQASERALREILERADCMLWRANVSLDGDHLAWSHFELPSSRLCAEIFGADRLQKTDMLWDSTQAPELAAMNERSQVAINAGASGYEQEYPVRQGNRLFLLNEHVTITAVGNDEWRLVGVVTDITARREAEEAKRATEAQLQHILKMADCMVWQATVDERPKGELYWTIFTPESVMYRRLFGEGHWTGDLDWASLELPEMAEMHGRAERAIRERHSGYEQEFRALLPAGDLFWLREVVTIVPNGVGSWKLVGVITDITAQREAQQAQRASVAQMEQLLASADCLLWQGRVLKLPNGRMRWRLFLPRSRLFRELFGRDPKEPATLEWREVVDPTTEEEIEQRAQTALVSGSPGYEQEFRAQRGDRVFWLHERVSITPVGVGEWELVGIMTDLSARRAAEQAVRASEVRYRTLYQHTPVAIVEADFTEVEKWLSGLRASGVTDLKAVLDASPPEVVRKAARVRFLDCNDTAMRVFKAKTKADFRHRRGLLGTMETLAVVRDAMFTIWEGRNTLEAEFKMRDFEGGLHEMSVRWWMGLTEHGLDLRQTVMVFVDLTELKQAEAALASEKERLAVTLRAMAEGVITTDIEGRVQFMNSAAAAFTQWTPEAAIGRPVTEVCVFTSDRTGAPLEVPFAQVAKGDVLVELPSRTKLTALNGTGRLVDGCCAPIHSASSKVIGIVLVFRDVTEHERLEQELVRASKLESVGILAGGIAHDFNNILTAVMGNIALAALDVDAKSDAGHSLREAEKATLRARDLTQQLLTFAKGGEPVRTAVQLDGIVREMTTFTLHGSNVRATYAVAADLWPADADKGQIGRVVQNLVLNAVQAMPQGGTINITLRNERVDGLAMRTLVPGDYVQIAIADTGAGIKPEHLTRIFDPYFTTKQHGTGLGLAAVYSIVNKHRGLIDVESQLGVGTTFRIWLPATHGPGGQAGLENRSVQTPALKGRVLFMDDEESIRQVASALLKRFGFEVVCVGDGAEAVAKFSEAKGQGRPFSLVIMDLTVPGGMGGREAITLLRQIDPKVRAIVSSGYSSDPILANHRSHGFAGVVAKPYEMADFARVLHDVMAEL